MFTLYDKTKSILRSMIRSSKLPEFLPMKGKIDHNASKIYSKTRSFWYQAVFCKSCSSVAQKKNKKTGGLEADPLAAVPRFAILK